MALFQKKTSAPAEPMDLDAVMKKFDQESNVRIWEGKGRLAVNLIQAAFSIFCIYVTLFTEPMDLDAVMKKFDQESNVRIWEGKGRLAVNLIQAAFSIFCIYVTLFTSWLEELRLTSFVAWIVFKGRLAVNLIQAAFSIFCIYVTLFTSWLEELRLTSFVAWIVFLGFLVFPARKSHQRPNHIPWYDIVAMVLGTGAFLYFTFHAKEIIQQGSNFTPFQILVGIVGILALAEVCRRSVGLPILIVAAAFLIYALHPLPDSRWHCGHSGPGRGLPPECGPAHPDCGSGILNLCPDLGTV